MKSSSALNLSILLALFIPVLFIGDIPWINDEPTILLKALQAKREGKWWELGLVSNNGMQYGPVPGLIYRGLLTGTSNLILLATVKTAFCHLLTVLGTVGALRALGLSWQIGIAVLLSPYLFFYHRFLWDNGFLIPFSALFIWFTILFDQKPSTKTLFGMLLAAWLLVHIHLMSVGLILPAIFIVGWARRHWLKENCKRVGLLIGVGVLSILPYAGLTIRTFSSGVQHAERPINYSAWILSYPFYPRFFSFAGFHPYFLPEFVELGGFSCLLYWGAVAGTLLPFVIFWDGLATAFRHRPLIFKWVIGGFLMNVLFFSLGKIGADPHYLNATWLLAFLPIGISVSRHWKNSWMRVAAGIYLVCQGSLLIYTVARIHSDGGNRGAGYGATLANQLEVAHALGRTPDAAIDWSVDNYRRFPHARKAIREFVQPLDIILDSPWVGYRDTEAARTGWIGWKFQKK